MGLGSFLRRAVGVQDLAAVRAARGNGPVGVQLDGPSEPVNYNVVMEPAEQEAVACAGLAAVFEMPHMVDLT